MKKKEYDVKSNILTTILLVVMALGAVTAVSMAWFSLSDSTKVYSMQMDVTTGPSIRFDLDKHDNFEDYSQTLSFDAIAQRIKSVYGFDADEIVLIPVTTNDGFKYTFEDGTTVEPQNGNYIRYSLHFISKEDMTVHLTSKSANGGSSPGTYVKSSDSGVVEALRIAFIVDGKTYVYDPGYGSGTYTSGSMKCFGLPSESAMVYNGDNALFELKEGIDKEVEVVIWLEGTDPYCVNDIKGKDFSISLRFEGTDKDGNLLR